MASTSDAVVALFSIIDLVNWWGEGVGGDRGHVVFITWVNKNCTTNPTSSSSLMNAPDRFELFILPDGVDK